MTITPIRGFHRLFVALTMLWAFFIAVFVPQKSFWDVRHQYEVQYQKDLVICLGLQPDGRMLTASELQTCDESAKQSRDIREESFLPRNSWGYYLEHWRRLVGLIIGPPLVLYALAALTWWVWRGFKSHGKEERTAN